MSDVQYHVLHRRRIKTMAGACNVLEHNLRKEMTAAVEEAVDVEIIKVPEYLDAELVKYNVIKGCLSRKEFCQEYQKKIDSAKLERKIQSNASRVIETVVSSSHSFCEDWKTNPEARATMKQYLEDAVAWEKDSHGDVALSVTYHWDETTPHAHILSVPLVQYIDKETFERKQKFSASEFFGAKGDLIKMHTDFHEKVGKKYGLERGQCGSRTSHRELKDYKNWEKEQRELLQKKELLLNEQWRKNCEHKNKIAEDAKKILSREQELKQKELKIGHDVKVLTIKQKQFETMVSKTNHEIPSIPEPPVSLSRSKLKVWGDSVQESVTKAFRGIKAAYEFVAMKYNKAVAEIHRLQMLNKQLNEENKQIKQDLLKKPIAEIIAHRESVERSSTQKKITRSNKDRDDRGFSR